MGGSRRGSEMSVVAGVGKAATGVCYLQDAFVLHQDRIGGSEPNELAWASAAKTASVASATATTTTSDRPPYFPTS